MLATYLSKLQNTHPYLVVQLYCAAYLFKQTWAIPGSVFMNLLAGAVFGLFKGFLLACLLSATGASLCFLWSYSYGSGIIQRLFPDKLTMFREKIIEWQKSQNLFFYLVAARLFPFTPNWFINMASPILGVPIHLFFISVFFGLMPYNFLCAQAGQFLSQLQSPKDVLTWTNVFWLLISAIVVMIPIFVKKRLQKEGVI